MHLLRNLHMNLHLQAGPIRELGILLLGWAGEQTAVDRLGWARFARFTEGTNSGRVGRGGGVGGGKGKEDWLEIQEEDGGF